MWYEIKLKKIIYETRVSGKIFHVIQFLLN